MFVGQISEIIEQKLTKYLRALPFATAEFASACVCWRLGSGAVVQLHLIWIWAGWHAVTVAFCAREWPPKSSSTAACVLFSCCCSSFPTQWNVEANFLEWHWRSVAWRHKRQFPVWFVLFVHDQLNKMMVHIRELWNLSATERNSSHNTDE